MRVARVLGRANVGGPIKTVLALCRGLRERGVVTRLFVGPPGEREGDRLEGVTDVDVVRVPELRRGANPLDLLGIRRLRQAFAEFAPDVVHTHAAKAGLLGRLGAARLRSKPVIVHTFHGHLFRGNFGRAVSDALIRYERAMARRTDAIVAVSPRDARDLVDEFRIAPRERVTVIENGIDLAPFADLVSKAVARVSLAALVPLRDVPVLVVPARLAAVKGHAVLFDALERPELRERDLDVVLLGDGPLRHALEARCATSTMRARVFFAGFVDRVEQVLPAADLVVLPSLNEGQPLAVIEAMAAGVPVLAAAVGGVPDLIEDGVTGRFVAPRDAEALARALRECLDDPTRLRACAARARERAFARHSIARVIDAHAVLYERVLREARGAST